MLTFSMITTEVYTTKKCELYYTYLMSSFRNSVYSSIFKAAVNLSHHQKGHKISAENKRSISVSYCKVCEYVREDNPRALAS